MKKLIGNMNTYTLSLCIAGSAILSPGWAQEAPAAPDVRAETHVFEFPDVHVQSQVIEVPEFHFQTNIDDNGVIRIVQGQAAGKVKNLLTQAQGADALNNYTVAQVYQNLGTLYSPEMAKKTREIGLLRQMLNLKLTARDIEQALPLLRDLKNADKVVPTKPEQALDEEYQGLLRARPGDPMPPSSADALRGAASSFRNRRLAIWDKMTQQLGKEKAYGIRAMLRTESNSVWSNGTMFQNFFTPGTPVSPLTAPRIRTRPESAPRVRPAQPLPDSDTRPDNPTSLNPAEGAGRVTRGARGGSSGAGSAVVAAGATQDPATQTESAAHIARSRVARQAGGQTDADDTAREKELEAREKLKEARDKEKEALKSAARAQRGTTANGFVLAPQARALTIDGNSRRITLAYYSQASIDELIDLFERKLAAMRR